MTYPFPDDVRNPDRKEPNPFADSDNPKEGTQPSGDAAAGGDIYQSGAAVEYDPVYETTYSDRVITILISGVVGLVMSLLGWLVFFGFPNNGLFGVFSLVFSIAAIIIARVDLSGMRSGAIKRLRSRYAAIGMVLGLVGLLNSLAIFAYGILFVGWFGIV